MNIDLIILRAVFVAIGLFSIITYIISRIDEKRIKKSRNLQAWIEDFEQEQKAKKP